MRGKTFRVVRWIFAVGIVIGLVAALAGCTPEESGAGDVVGQGYVSGDGSVQTYDAGERKGPVAIAGTDFEGEDVDTVDWAGDVVVVNTWYAACAPCRAEAPDLVDLAGSKDGVQFLGINTEDAAGAAQAFQRTFEVPYPSIEDRTGTVIAGLNGVVPLQAVPTTVVLDQEGYVAARVIGQVEGSTLEALIDDVLAEAA
ncbi:TlpA family protein disulfide reductase [Promicromonospora iranensis]|uniref:Thiol-disulfide isomerase/thioredoxin n=1 Tax=Promicromonospora iranensis TaxID=1105144 RepID=A0ABU2CN65_9MICO|nr:TlpA disulfide reductase family protein [Promicromonospora iranensis]MDR7382711.1 thiol-disulfide isomerase/thioredoxin [Promicromonospora iranensis]